MEQYGTVETPWGRLGVTYHAAGIRRVQFDVPVSAALTGEWAAAFAGYLTGEPIAPTLPVDLAGVPPFTRRVLLACRAIPFGTVTTYGHLAEKLGCANAARAVGQALARNPLPIVLPCHRVVGAAGQLTGFLGGLAWKQRLLHHEGLDAHTLLDMR